MWCGAAAICHCCALCPGVPVARDVAKRLYKNSVILFIFYTQVAESIGNALDKTLFIEATHWNPIGPAKRASLLGNNNLYKKFYISMLLI